MVIGVVVLHSAVSYSSLVPWWCVIEPNEYSAFFDTLLLLLDVFLMPILYFIAGYFATSSYQKKGTRLFLNRKFRRLGIPLIIGIPLVSPIFAYIYHYTRSGYAFGLPFHKYWASYMAGAADFNIGIITSINQFNQCHFWFISLLLFFFLNFALFAHKKKWAPTPLQQESSANAIFIALAVVGGASAVSSLIAIRIFASPGNPEPWITIGNFLQFQPIRLIPYLLYFGLGVYAFHHKWFIRVQIPGHLALWSLLCAGLGISLLIMLKKLMLNFSINLLILYTFTRSFLCASLFATLASSAFRYWNQPSPFSARLSLNSYHIYIIHFLVVILLQLLLSYWDGVPVSLKFALVSSLSILLSYGLSQHAVRPFPRLSTAIAYLLLLMMLITTGVLNA
jgi:hypothetical protein